MASKFRYRGGVVRHVSLKTNASYPIEEGDLVYESGGYALPASALADAGSAAQNRAAFAAAFAGVALHKTGLQSGETSARLTTDKGYTLVAVSGDFAYDCDAAVWANGALVGVYADADGCEDQKVMAADDGADAIGSAVVPYNALGTSQTEVIVSLRSKLMHDNIAASGA